MTNTIAITVPKETVSDDEYIVVDILKSGTLVKSGTTVATLETSKSTFEIHAPADGYFLTRFTTEAPARIGQIIGAIATSNDHTLIEELTGPIREEQQPRESSDGEQRFSRGAIELMQTYGLDKAQFTGMGLVRREDVERVLQGQRGLRDEQRGDEGGAAKVLFLGGGGHAKMCIDIIRQTNGLEIYGIADASIPQGTRVMDVPVVAKDSQEDLQRIFNEGVRFAINAIGASTNHRSRALHYHKLCKAGYHLPNIIHPKSSVEPSVHMGVANQIMANATVGSMVRIGSNCIINSSSVISHDCLLGNNVHIAPGALLAGAVEVGDDSIIGMGVTVFLGIRIGRGAVIANGTHIFKDVPDNAIIRR